MLLLTESRGLQDRYGGPTPGAGELSQALHAFFAGQNFELAELWSDAVQSYKTVLLCTNQRAPIQQAAERLKVLEKSHPEGFPAHGAKPISPSREVPSP